MTEERSGKQCANAAAILTPSLDRSSEYVRFAQLATGQSEAPRHELVEASDLVVGDARTWTRPRTRYAMQGDSRVSFCRPRPRTGAPLRRGFFLCARHGVDLGGGSPLGAAQAQIESRVLGQQRLAVCDVDLVRHLVGDGRHELHGLCHINFGGSKSGRLGARVRRPRSRRLRRHPRSHASNIRIDLPDTQRRSQIIMDSPDQVSRNHRIGTLLISPNLSRFGS